MNVTTHYELMKALKLNETAAKILITMMDTNVLTVDEIMDVANLYMDQCGVEALKDERAWINHYYGNIIALYVNTGETYDMTLLYDTENQEFLLTSWGDFYENWESENRESIEE